MSRTQTYQKEREEHKKQANQKDRKVYETQPNEKALVWMQTQLHPKQWKDYEEKEESRQKAKNGEPIVVINHLNYRELDVLTMVEQVLTKNEFSDDSSIFVVVPSVDNDEGNTSDGQNSTICLQMCPNPTKWKKKVNPVKHDPKQHRNAAAAHQGVKISAKGKRFYMEGLPMQILSFHNKETLLKHGNPMLIENGKKATHNKLCQISTPNGKVERIEHRCNVVSMDTTADRPCCCNPTTTQNSNDCPKDRHVVNVMSKLVTPVLEQGMIGDPFYIKWGVKQQESVMSITVPASSPCHTQYVANPAQYPANHALYPANPAQYLENPAHYPDNPAQYPAHPAQLHDNPAQHHAKACSAQKSTNLESQMKACQCSPETMLELLKLAVKEGKIQHMLSTGCGECPQPPEPQALGPPPAAQSKEPECPELYKMEPTSTPTRLTNSECPCG